MKDLLNVWQKPSDSQWFASCVAAAVLVFAVLWTCCSNGQVEPAGSTQPETVVTETMAVTTAETTPGCSSPPSSCKGCPVGHTDRAVETRCLYRYETIGDLKWLHCEVMLQPNDVVQITGGPETIADPPSGEYCKVKVLQGSIYAEDGEEWFIASDACMYQTTLGDRPVPDFRIGETVLLAYNFQLHKGPAGSVELDGSGQPILVRGGWSAVITNGPTLAKDGRYWCTIKVIGMRLAGDTYCEYEKIN